MVPNAYGDELLVGGGSGGVVRGGVVRGGAYMPIGGADGACVGICGVDARGAEVGRVMEDEGLK